MSNKKKRLNIIDYLIIFVVILILCSSFARRVYVEKIGDNKTFFKTEIVLVLSDVDILTVNQIQQGDSLYSKEHFGNNPFGIITSLTEQLPSPGYSADYVDEQVSSTYELRVTADCSLNIDGEYAINGTSVSPGYDFYADNGLVGFWCEITQIEEIN